MQRGHRHLVHRARHPRRGPPRPAPAPSAAWGNEPVSAAVIGMRVFFTGSTRRSSTAPSALVRRYQKRSSGSQLAATVPPTTNSIETGAEKFLGAGIVGGGNGGLRRERCRCECEYSNGGAQVFMTFSKCCRPGTQRRTWVPATRLVPTDHSRSFALLQDDVCPSRLPYRHHRAPVASTTAPRHGHRHRPAATHQIFLSGGSPPSR